MAFTVRLHNNEGIIEIQAEKGQNLLDILRNAGSGIESPCGGNGKCGKCRVRVAGIDSTPSESENLVLGAAAILDGFRLACLTKVLSDLDIYTAEGNSEAKIAVKGKKRAVKLEPYVVKRVVELEPPSLEDQKSDLHRVLDGIDKTSSDLSIKDFPVHSPGLIRKLPSVTRGKDDKVTLVLGAGRLLDIEPGDTSKTACGVAVDIGTTTIAAYLYSLSDGKGLDVLSCLNPQRKFGADVISRIDYTISKKDGLNDMSREIIRCINDVISNFCKNACIEARDIYSIVLAGNTTMLHFLMNVSAANIAVSPFIPATAGPHCFKAADLGMVINQEGLALLLPCVSAYVGADTVAAVLSSGMYARNEVSLLIDIGTNGEIVISNGKSLYACSTAAGPAFEGANIRNGMGGVNGAIDSVKLIEGSLKFTVIGGSDPAGICGSGLLDAVAQMLKAGIIDETGRLPDPSDMNGCSAEYSKRIVTVEGGAKAFLLVEAEKSAAGGDIAISQKDIRELQNAKAAIAAGIYTLAAKAGVRVENIERVYLAGGFGSYLNKESAVTIGLIPDVLASRIESLGNAAGAGAVEALLSAESFQESVTIRDRIEYVELSSSAEFTDKYIDCMIFPEY